MEKSVEYCDACGKRPIEVNWDTEDKYGPVTYELCTTCFHAFCGGEEQTA